MVKIKVNKELCIGCGSCEAICPKTFALKDGKAYAKQSEVKKITCEKEAADSCPVSAISIK